MSKAQESVKELLQAVPRSAERGNADIEGDVDVTFDDVTGIVEVKRATDGGQVYQVRAIRFVALVVHDPKEPAWYVVPASDLVRIIAKCDRGMHTEIAFESRQLGLARERGGELTPYKCALAALPEKIRAALLKDRADTAARALMDELAGALKELQRQYSARAGELT